jgi:methyl-accepting chemotaxis protein
MAGINFRSIRNRLILGYGSMALLLVIVVAITLMQIGQIMLYGFEVLEVKQPSRLYLLEINSGVRHSNSILQTYLLTGDEEFRDQISSIWEKEIDAARDSVDALKVDWVNPENFIEFEKLNRLLSRIKNKQEEIASSASFGGGAVNINLYNYSALSGDTIIGVDNLQTWINSAISDASAQAPDNGSLYNDGLVELSNQVNLIVSTLYTNFYDESLEIRDKIFAERAQFIVVESIIVIGSILLCFLLFRFVLRKINQSVGVLKGEVNTLSAGNIPHKRKETGDELDAVLEEIDILSQNLADVKSFALEVGKGNFDNDITVFNNEGVLKRYQKMPE